MIVLRNGWLSDKFILEALGENSLGLFGPHECSVDIPTRALEGSEDYYLRIALNANQKVGYCMAEDFGSDLYLRQLFVAAEANHQGVGSTLMKDLLEHAKAKGYGSISLLTSANAPWSVPFYKKFGFDIPPVDRLPNHIRSNLHAAAQTDAIKSIPGYLPLCAMSRKLDNELAF